MAKTLEEIVAGLQLSADEKKLFDNVLAKSDDLKKGWLRQDEFSRRMDEMKAKQTEYEEAVAYKTKMEPWADDAYARIKKLEDAGVIDPEGNELWTAKKTQYEKDIEAAKLAGGDMKPEEIEKIVSAKVEEIRKTAGGLTREEAQALYQAESKKIAEATFNEQWKAKESDFNTKTIPFVAGFSAAASIVAAHYEAESGEKWNAERQKEMYDMMARENNFDPFKIEEKLLAPIRGKKELEKKIEEEAEKRYKKMLADRGMPEGGHERYIPQPDEARGALQKALEASATVDVRDAVRAAAVEGAKELIAAGKA